MPRLTYGNACALGNGVVMAHTISNNPLVHQSRKYKPQRKENQVSVLMVLFEMLPDGSQQVISSQTFGSREEAITAFDEMTASIFVGPGCHNYQIDLVDRQSITDLVEVYIPNTDAAIAWGNETWASWQALKTGDVVTVSLGGDFTNSHPADTDCRVPTIDDGLPPFKPTPVPDQPAVPLTVASVEPPAGPHDPTPTPLPPTTPTATTTALVALTSDAAPLPNTGAHAGPLTDAAVALMALGAVFVWLTRKCKLNANR